MVRFRMCKISTEQFAILTDDEPENDMQISINTSLQYLAATNAKRLACRARFLLKGGDSPFLVLEVMCEFDIHPEDWAVMQSECKVRITKETQEFLAVHTIGTARGILHCKTEGTAYNKYIIPPLNVANMIKDDVVVPIEVRE